MKWIRTTVTTLTAASIATVVGACSGGGGVEKPTQSTSSGPATTSPAPSVSTPTTAIPPTPYDPNSPRERAKEAVRAYFQVSDECMQDPVKAKLTCFDSVAVSTELNDRRNALNSAKAASTKQVGSLRIVSMKPEKIDLTNKQKDLGVPCPEPSVQFLLDDLAILPNDLYRPGLVIDLPVLVKVSRDQQRVVHADRLVAYRVSKRLGLPRVTRFGPASIRRLSGAAWTTSEHASHRREAAVSFRREGG